MFVLQVNVLNLNTDNSLTDFKDVSDEVVKDQDGIVQDYKKSMKKVKGNPTTLDGDFMP